jgi:hypothetical protein
VLAGVVAIAALVMMVSLLLAVCGLDAVDGLMKGG